MSIIPRGRDLVAEATEGADPELVVAAAKSGDKLFSFTNDCVLAIY
jgi:hypothetical protein